MSVARDDQKKKKRRILRHAYLITAMWRGSNLPHFFLHFVTLDFHCLYSSLSVTIIEIYIEVDSPIGRVIKYLSQVKDQGQGGLRRF